MKNKTIIALMGSALLLGACQSPSDDQSPDDTTQQTESESSTNEETSSTNDSKGIQDTDFDVSLKDATEIFEDEYGEMDIYAVELTTENGVYQYEIKGYKEGTEKKVHIDAESGEVLDSKEKDDDGDHLKIDFDKLISTKDAMNNALQELEDGAYISSWELGEEDGKMVYEIEYDFEDSDKDDGDINIDAYSGDVLEK